jgi:hypothetical protein
VTSIRKAISSVVVMSLLMVSRSPSAQEPRADLESRLTQPTPTASKSEVVERQADGQHLSLRRAAAAFDFSSFRVVETSQGRRSSSMLFARRSTPSPAQSGTSSTRRFGKGRLIGIVASFATAGLGAYLYSTWDGTVTDVPGSCSNRGGGVTVCTGSGGDNTRRDSGLLLMILGVSMGLGGLFL